MQEYRGGYYEKTIGVSVIAASLALASCSGGGAGGAASGGSGSTPTELSSATATAGALSGTAAVGAPLGLAAVTIKGSAGLCSTTALTGTTNSVGVYSITVPDDCTEPYLISVTGSTGSLKTIAPAKGIIANVTPLTELIAKRATNLSDLNNVNLSNIASIATDLQHREDEIKQVLKGIAAGIGAASSEAAFAAMDLRSGSFAANGSGLDKLLDAVKINTNGGNEDVVVGGVTVSVPVNPATSMPAAPNLTAVSSAVSAANTALSKLTSVKSFYQSFANEFSSSVPSEDTVLSYLANDFLHDGVDRDYFYEDVIEDNDRMIGMQIRNVIILPDLDGNVDTVWASAQMFRAENGAYKQVKVFIAELDLSGSQVKLKGNRLPFAVWPNFVKYYNIDATNTAQEASTIFRVLELGMAFGGANANTYNSNTYVLKKFNDVDIRNFNGSNGSISIQSGLQTGISSSWGIVSDLLVVDPGDAKKPVSKLTYSHNSTDYHSYVEIPMLDSINNDSFVGITYPNFETSSTTTDNCKWNQSTYRNFDEDSFDLSTDSFELDALEIYFNDYSKSYSFPGYSEYENLTSSGLMSEITLYDTQDQSRSPSPLNYLKVGKIDLAVVGAGGMTYRTLYICE